MTKIIINCRETGENRIYENCRPLTDNPSVLHKQVNLCSGDWQAFSNVIQISIPSKECFYELTSLIELSIEDTWIVITVENKIMSIFKKTPSLSEKWKDIISHATLYGGKVYGNTFVFQKCSNASAFNKRFCDLFI